MNQDNRDDDRETIWGINRKDRRLFQTMTLIGGNVGSVVVTILILKYRPYDQTADILTLSILLGIGASFVASGFITWDLVQIKEVTMAIGDWIREATEKRRQQIRDEGREKGREEGRKEGQIEGLKQALRERVPQAREEGRQQGREEMRREMLAQSAIENTDDDDTASQVQEQSTNRSLWDDYLAGYEDAQRGRPLAGRASAYVDGYSDAQRGHPLNPPTESSSSTC